MLLDRLCNAALANGGCLMLSSGESFLAGPERNASLVNGVPYHDAISMQLVGYHGVCIDDHDFDFGPDILANFDAKGNVTAFDPGSGPVRVAGDGVPDAVAASVASLAANVIAQNRTPLDDLPFESLGVSYQQDLFNSVTDELDDVISAVDYPRDGEGRIIRIDHPAELDGAGLMRPANFPASWPPGRTDLPRASRNPALAPSAGAIPWPSGPVQPRYRGRERHLGAGGSGKPRVSRGPRPQPTMRWS